MAGESKRARRILIYRLGSLGDTIVSLPCFRLVARAFPDAERRLLTNVPVSDKAAPLELILGGSGLVDGVMRHPIGLRRPGEGEHRIGGAGGGHGHGLSPRCAR